MKILIIEDDIIYHKLYEYLATKAGLYDYITIIDYFDHDLLISDKFDVICFDDNLEKENMKGTDAVIKYKHLKAKKIVCSASEIIASEYYEIVQKNNLINYLKNLLTIN